MCVMFMAAVLGNGTEGLGRWVAPHTVIGRYHHSHKISDRHNSQTRVLITMVRPSKVGVVISQGKMDKTVKVRFRNSNWNRHVSKYIVSHRNMLVHDELNKCREGDVVRVQYVRPLSTKKSWAVAEFMRLKGTSWEQYQQEIPTEVEQDEVKKLQEFRKLRESRQKLGGEAPEVYAARNGESAGKQQIALELDHLESDIESLSTKLDGLSFMAAEARRILNEEPERANAILEGLGKTPANLNPSMKRNLIAKALKTN